MRKARGFWGAVGLFAGLLIVAYLAAPQVEHFSPSAQSPHISSSVPIRISFSRPMDQVSVEARVSITPQVPGEFNWDGNTVVFRPAQPWAAGTTVEVNLLAGARSTLFLPIVSNASWTFEVGQPRLGYLWPADSAADLYIYDVLSGETERITQSQAGVLDFTVAGTTTAYVELRSDGRTALRALDLETGADELLYECPATDRCRSPALDPSGERLAFERFSWQSTESGQRVPGDSTIMLLALGEGAEPQMIGPPGQSTETPSWSASGTLAYYNASLQAIALQPSPASGLPELIPNGLGLLGSWSPDGRFLIVPEIAFPTEQEAGQVEFYSHLYRIDALSTAVSELSRGSVEDASPSYSPDGQWIAFARKYLDERWTPGRQLWLMRSDGTQPEQLTDQPDFSHSAISWSPDSQQLAYMQRSQTDANLPPQIWVSDLSGEQQRMLVQGGYLPQWLP